MSNHYLSDEEGNTFTEDITRLEKAVTAYDRVKQVGKWKIEDSSQRRFALETILSPIGMTKENALSMEGLGDKIKLYGNKVWGRIKKFLGAVKAKVKSAWRWARGTQASFVADEKFLSDYEVMLRAKLDHHDAEAAIQRIHKVLIVAYLTPHNEAYSDKIASRLKDDESFETHLGFRSVKVSREGQNSSVSNGVPEQMEGKYLLEYVKELKAIGELSAKRVGELEDLVGDSVGDAKGSEARYRRRALVTASEMGIDAKTIIITSSYVKNALRQINIEYAASGIGKDRMDEKEGNSDIAKDTKAAKKELKERKKREAEEHKYRYG